ncbi:hypothetical protein [Abyssibacter profundi]|nr:hypothetical protein [Abyssibacter profundi]
MSWLAARLSGAAAPYMAGAGLLLVLLLCGVAAVQGWQLHTARTSLAQAEAQVAHAQRKHAQCETEVVQREADIAQQNARIDQLQAEAAAAAQRADARAASVMAAERARVRAIPAGHGPAAMNRWLQQVVGE